MTDSEHSFFVAFASDGRLTYKETPVRYRGGDVPILYVDPDFLFPANWPAFRQWESLKDKLRILKKVLEKEKE